LLDKSKMLVALGRVKRRNYDKKDVISTFFHLNIRIFEGEVAEWFKAHAWKACVGLPLPRVRIPPSPPPGCTPVVKGRCPSVKLWVLLFLL
jgi:hypothetical protein